MYSSTLEEGYFEFEIIIEQYDTGPRLVRRGCSESVLPSTYLKLEGVTDPLIHCLDKKPQHDTAELERVREEKRARPLAE